MFRGSASSAIHLVRASKPAWAWSIILPLRTIPRFSFHTQILPVKGPIPFACMHSTALPLIWKQKEPRPRSTSASTTSSEISSMSNRNQTLIDGVRNWGDYACIIPTSTRCAYLSPLPHRRENKDKSRNISSLLEGVEIFLVSLPCWAMASGNLRGPGEISNRVPQAVPQARPMCKWLVWLSKWLVLI
jgi:hypothetical protein